MSTEFQVSSAKYQVPGRNSEIGVLCCPSIENRKSKIENGRAFTLIEVMVVSALLALIILALMTVFNGTQAAFRAGITQTDVLESGRAVSDLIKGDLEAMTPSLYPSNAIIWPDPFNMNNNVNFYVTNSGSTVLLQSLPGSGSQRTNVLENFFILTRQNRTWTGIGYVVDPLSQPTNSLYRFSMSTNVMAAGAGPASLYNAFVSNPLTNSPPWSHLMDGVVHLTVRAYDTNGVWMNGTYTNALNFRTNSTMWGESSFYMFSNTVPASVEMELGVLEDRTLQRAESIPIASAQTAYLSSHVGQVHIFRQRVWIRNVDPSAYQ